MMDIRDLAKKTGIHAKTIRHYEEVGLISTANRPLDSCRTYDQDDVNALGFIKRARKMGFSLDDVRNLLNLPEGNSQTCSEIRETALQHLAELDLKIEELSLIRNTLADAIRNSDGNLSSEDLLADATMDALPLYQRFL